jgi:hypothetical protein
MPDTPQDMVAWVAKLSRNQPAPTFLAKVVANKGIVAALLRSEASSSESIEERAEFIATLAQQIKRKSFVVKAINTFWFWTGILPLAIGSLWQFIEFWLLKRQADLTTGLIESAILVAGGFSLGQYRRWIKKQIKMSQALKTTLFADESADQKARRLQGILNSSEAADNEEAKYDQVPVQWWFSTFEEAKAKIAPVTSEQLTPEQVVSITIQLKDAGIVNLAFSWLIRIMTALAVMAIAIGLGLPLLNKFLNLQLSYGNLGSYQSVFVVGFGGLMLSIRRLYVEKRNRLQSAVRTVFAKRETFKEKEARILAAFSEIDTLLVHD